MFINNLRPVVGALCGINARRTLLGSNIKAFASRMGLLSAFYHFELFDAIRYNKLRKFRK